MKFIYYIDRKFNIFYDYTGHHFLKLLLFFHIIYFIVILGIVSLNIDYINYFYYTLNIILCIFLIIRFNPLREKHNLRANDPKMIFSISFFLLLNTFIIETIKLLYPSKYDKIKKYTKKE